MPIAPAKKNQDNYPLTVIIPSAGKGNKKQAPSLECLPNGDVLINHQLKTVRKVYKNSDIALVVGYESRNIINSLKEYARVIENENFLHTNTSRSIQLGLQIFPQIEDLLIIHGDVFFNEESIKTLRGGDSCLVLDNLELQNDNAVGVITQENKVIRCTYKDFPKWGHIVYLSKKEVKILNKIVKTGCYENCFTEELINLVIDNGGEFTTFTSPKNIAIEINRYDSKKIKTTYSGSTTTCH